MSLAHRELANALKIKKQLEELDKQAERFKSLSQVNVIALQETARGMASAAAALSGVHARGIFTSKISSHMIPSIPYNDINFTEITNNLVNNFQKFSNNWVTPNTFISMPILRIDIYKPINILESTVDIGNNEVEENLADNMGQDLEVDERDLITQDNLSIEIGQLRSDLHQIRRGILILFLRTLVSYSFFVNLLERPDKVLLSVLIILGNYLLYRWDGEHKP